MDLKHPQSFYHSGHHASRQRVSHEKVGQKAKDGWKYPFLWPGRCVNIPQMV
jgi:hypothetical protein